ncbi:2-C-methyl-D-erythritol 4-phosphate cytidylyltransferase [Proteobacteria bacterium 005FR1]|nr:2-C-methyl-D-erythritol 4-phosphate cytidylyltransferase [Proteobacteria bacterium 005FR1]
MSGAADFWAIVPAAGVGRRMQQSASNNRPKQYLPLLDKTVIEHSLHRLLSLSQLRQVVVALSPDDPHWDTLEVSSDSRVERVAGGEERHVSVFNALKALADRAAEHDWVLVHDAVRPCVSPACIRRLMDNLETHPVGGLLGYPLADTLKKVDQAGAVERTVDRTGMWAAATPQMFRYGTLMKALEAFIAEGRLPTDEAMAVESFGLRPQMVAGRRDNIKITVPGDLELATVIINAQASGPEPEEH